MSSLEFRVLGPVEVFRDGKIVPLGRGTSPVLLTGLLLQANEAVQVDSLAAMVWTEKLPEHPRAALASGMSRLRRLLGEDVIDAPPECYRLRVGADQLDLLKFHDLIAAARTAAGRQAHEEAVGALEQAIGLWRDPILRNVNSAVLHRDVVPSLVERYLDAQEDRANLYLLLGRHADVIDNLLPLTRAHPFRERMVGQLMIALYRGGRQADALATYERIRAALSGELGIDPGPELQDLYLEILRADPRLGWVSPTPEIETHEAGQGPTVRPAESEVIPRQLPAVTGPAHGREAELAELDRMLEGSGAGPLVVSIVGPGGIGKTALAVQWAHQIADRFPDGQLYINLRGYGPDTPLSLAAALERLLRSLPIDPTQVPADIEECTALLRSLLSERRMLIVLDNARDTAQVRPLLPGSACAVLVTSRNQLRGFTARDGAHRVTLGPIGVDAARAVFAAASGRHASEFPVDQVADLLDVCAGLPLAIRIIAERLARDEDAHDLAAVNTALRGRSLDELDSGDGDLTDMRAIVSWSYHALDEKTSRTFQLIATHPGPDIGLPAAAALLGRSLATTRRLLDRLTGVHLIEQRRQYRYAMHDLLRAYGRERSQFEGPNRQAIERLFDWYTQTAFNARELLYPRPSANRVEPPGGQVDAMEFTDVQTAQEWFGLEYPVLVAVIEHAAGHGYEEHAWKIAWALWEYFYRHKLWDSWTATLETGLAAARRCRSRAGEMQMLDGLGGAYWAKGLWERSIELRDEALNLARAEGNRYREATILQNIGVACYAGGDGERSFEYLRQALRILDEFANAPDRTMVLNNLGELLNRMGRHTEAIDYLSRGLADIKHSVTDRNFSSLVDNLGVARAGLADHNGALEQFEIALANNRGYHYRFREALNLLHIGDSLAATGDRRAALDRWQASLEIYIELGIPEADEVCARIEQHNRTPGAHGS